VTFNFDSRDEAYRDSWGKYHYAVCTGQAQSGSQSGIQKPGIRQLPGYMFLGATGGAAIGWALSPKMDTSQPEIIRAAGMGAFYGAVFMGLLWVVKAF
jgi:hypothetical protein